MTHKFTIAQELEVQDVVAEAFLSCAVEGGINYWASINRKVWVPGHGPYDPKGSELQYQSVEIFDNESDDDEEPSRWTVDYLTVARGMEALLTGKDGVLVGGTTYTNVLKCLVDWDNSDYDSIDADIVVQLGLFGEVVYG